MNIERKHKLYLLYPNKYPFPEYEYCQKYDISKENIDEIWNILKKEYNMNINNIFELLKYFSDDIEILVKYISECNINKNKHRYII